MNKDLVSGFDHIHINAPPGGREDARWFYGGVLGLREVASPEAMVSDSGLLRFELADGQRLHLTFERSTHAGAAGGCLAFSVPSVAAVLEALRSNGFDVRADDGGGGDGVRCFCRDPFGNRLEFVERPAVSVRGAA